MKPLPRWDPDTHIGPLLRAMSAFARTDAGSWFMLRVAAPLDPKLMRLTGGRVRFGFGPRAMLTTRGRKSGEPRAVSLAYFTHGDDVVLIASSFGRDAHPAWFLNVRADPRVTLAWAGGQGNYVARIADDAERDELFGIATSMHSGYAKYQAGTPRKIPVVLLSPARA